MNIRKYGICIAGAAAGIISGLFGAGGGMVLQKSPLRLPWPCP